MDTNQPLENPYSIAEQNSVIVTNNDKNQH